jgi:hypothetical protein
MQRDPMQRHPTFCVDAGPSVLVCFALAAQEVFFPGGRTGNGADATLTSHATQCT